MNNPHVQNALDLITTRDARRSGFLEYALRRNKESLPFVDRAKALKAVLVAHTTHPRDILHLTTIRESLLEAAGISVKAKAHLSEDDKQGLLVDFIEKVLLPSGGSYIDEVIYRYLLTAGDALGGKMRNIIGSIAKEKVIRFMGELKGGVDPAGADEHWKTANSALGRIRGAFADKLSLMFIGAAIEPAMASEIFLQYQSGDLANCANLTNDDQLATLCEWMVRL